MSRQKHTAEQIIGKLREAEVLQSHEQNPIEACLSVWQEECKKRFDFDYQIVEGKDHRHMKTLLEFLGINDFSVGEEYRLSGFPLTLEIRQRIENYFKLFIKPNYVPVLHDFVKYMTDTRAWVAGMRGRDETIPQGFV